MIATLEGRITAKGEDYIIVDVSGVGFMVHMPPALQDRLGGAGDKVSLFTHLHVRENELELYGFVTPEELRLFELLLGVSGIGPKVASRIVSVMSVEALREAISRGDAAMLTHIPGVGKKTAERLMVDLKDKLGVELELTAYPGLTHADAEVISALTSLGYSITEAQAALRSLPRENLSLEERVRLALQYFARE
ncbi:MAG: Holliday junction branch migration protein RuvA [Candidatus Hadarchaeum sp.]